MGDVVVAGLGAVGARVARQVHTAFPDSEVVLVADGRGREPQVVAALGTRARTAGWDEALAAHPDVVVLCGKADHKARAEVVLDGGAHVVSTAGAMTEVEELLALDPVARAKGRTVVVGAAFSPGLSCLLARHAVSDGADPEEVRVASVGAGGPACARAAREALGRSGREWDAASGGWVDVAPGSGRELCWFPDPVAARDCYRGELAETVLLHGAFPHAARITARRGASRGDLALARAPGLADGAARLPVIGGRITGRRREGEGEIGALRVDVTTGSTVRVLGAIDRPAAAAGAVAGVAARWAVDGRFAPGAAGLASLVRDTVSFLGRLSERGVRAATLG